MINNKYDLGQVVTYRSTLCEVVEIHYKKTFSGMALVYVLKEVNPRGILGNSHSAHVVEDHIEKFKNEEAYKEYMMSVMQNFIV